MSWRRFNRKIPELNTTSTADISFVLLILFLVTTSLDPDKGIMRILPSFSESETLKPEQIKERNLLDIRITADGSVMCRDKITEMSELKENIKNFIDNPSSSDSLPEKSLTEIPLLGVCMTTSEHVISVETHRDAPYSSYFKVHDIIDKAYRELRDELAMRKFGVTFSACSDTQHRAVEQYYTQHISEVYNTIEKEKNNDI